MRREAPLDILLLTAPCRNVPVTSTLDRTNGPFALSEHTWKSADFPLCQVSLSAANLADQLKLPLQTWDEDGLGPASGFLCQIPFGLVVLVQDFALAPALGASLHIDASDLAEQGVQLPLREILSAFSLAPDVVTWEQTEEGVESARLIVDECRKRRGDAV